MRMVNELSRIATKDRIEDKCTLPRSTIVKGFLGMPLSE